MTLTEGYKSMLVKLFSITFEHFNLDCICEHRELLRRQGDEDQGGHGGEQGGWGGGHLCGDEARYPGEGATGMSWWHVCLWAYFSPRVSQMFGVECLSLSEVFCLSSSHLIIIPHQTRKMAQYCQTHAPLQQFNVLFFSDIFLAPTGALGVTMYFCLSENSQRALREHSESNQSIKIRVIQSEPPNTGSCFVSFACFQFS